MSIVNGLSLYRFTLGCGGDLYFVGDDGAGCLVDTAEWGEESTGLHWEKTGFGYRWERESYCRVVQTPKAGWGVATHIVSILNQ